jgi:hypothetical protein
VDAIYFTQSVFRVVFPFLLLFYLIFCVVDAKSWGAEAASSALFCVFSGP